MSLRKARPTASCISCIPSRRKRAAAAIGPAASLATPPARFKVSSIVYSKMHQVDAAQLRPRWLWAPAAGVWRYELAVGHGCVPAGEQPPTFKFAGGVLRGRN